MGKTRSVSLAFFSFRFLFACTEKLHEMKESCDFYCLNFFILVFKKSALLSILVRSFSNSGTFALIYLFIYFFHYACVWLLRKTRGNRDFWVFSNALLLFWCATPARVSFWIDSLWVARSFFFFLVSLSLCVSLLLLRKMWGNYRFYILFALVSKTLLILPQEQASESILSVS